MEPVTESENVMTVFAKVWHPCGAECLIQFDGQLPPIQSMPAFLDHLRKQGWLTANPNAPASGGGMRRIEVASVSRRATVQNGKTIDIIDFYSSSPNMKHKAATLYLDRAERINGFSQFSGLRPEQVPLNPGQAAIQQGTPAAPQFIIPCKPLVVVVEPNPVYSQAKADAAKAPGAAPYKTSPVQFVRFEAVGQPPSGVNSDRRVEQQPGSGPRPAQSGPVNGVIADPDFRKLLNAKGWTWNYAMQQIDKNNGTTYAASAKTAGDIHPEILRGLVDHLNRLPNKQQRPHEPASYGNTQPDDRADHGEIPF